MSVASVSKAIAGALVTALVAYLSRKGILLTPEISEAVTVLVAAAIGFLGVYISPKNKEV